MKEITFTVFIGDYNEIEVDVDVTKSEYALIQEHIENGDADFCECDDVAALYQRVLDAAYDEMANGVYDDKDFIECNLGGTYNFDEARKYIVSNYELSAQWPDIEEEDQ